MREDAVARLEQRGAVLADAQAAVDVVVVDGLRPGEQGRGDGGRRGLRRGELGLPGSPHLVQRPAQVDGRGPRGQQAARGLLERGPERGRVVRARGGRLGGRERDAAGRRDADGRRAADRHVADAVRDLAPGAAGDVALLLRQGELVDEHDLAGQDLDGAHAQARTAGPAALAGARRSPAGLRPRGVVHLRRPSIAGYARCHQVLLPQVPWSQEARYLACSSVSVSHSTAIDSSLSRAISSSMSLGTT